MAPFNSWSVGILTNQQFLGSSRMTIKHHINSAQRFKQSEQRAKVWLYITAALLGMGFFLMCLWSV